MLTFGKYRGQQLKDVFVKDKRYIEWLLSTSWYSSRYSSLEIESKKIIYNHNHTIVLKDNINIYTDGACPFNGMKGATCGIGIHFCETNRNKLDDVSELFMVDKPTNNIAELGAIDRAIQIVIDKELSDKHINLYTDSKYSIDCITKWYAIWLKNNKLERPNIDIIQSIYENIQNLNIDFIHVRAHTKKNDVHSIGNSRADSLATKCVYDYLNPKTSIKSNEL